MIFEGKIFYKPCFFSSYQIQNLSFVFSKFAICLPNWIPNRHIMLYMLLKGLSLTQKQQFDIHHPNPKYPFVSIPGNFLGRNQNSICINISHIWYTLVHINKVDVGYYIGIMYWSNTRKHFPPRRYVSTFGQRPYLYMNDTIPGLFQLKEDNIMLASSSSKEKKMDDRKQC